MNLRQAAQQALEALERGETKLRWAAITALRAALAEPQTTHWEGCEAVHPECRKQEQEPVASLMTNIQSGDQKVVWNDDGFDRALWHETPLYTAPTPRKPLSDEQIMSIDVLRYHFALNGGAGPISKKGKEIIDAIERAHGIGEQHE